MRVWTKALPDPFSVDPDGEVYWWRKSSDTGSQPALLIERHGGLNAAFIGTNVEECAVSIGGEWLGPITPDDVARADAYEDLTEGGHVTIQEGASMRGAPSLTATAAAADLGQAARELRMTPGEIKPLTATDFVRRAQHAADARVGRMLREIKSAPGVVGVGYWDDDAIGYRCKVLMQGMDRDREYEAPDALERAHAEVCGEGKPDNKIHGKLPDDYPATGVPIRTDLTMHHAEPTTEGNVYLWKLRCTRCRDMVGAETTEAWAKSATCGACGAPMVAMRGPPAPAKPDYASMSEAELLYEVGLANRGSSFVTVNGAKLRAALIAFLESR